MEALKAVGDFHRSPDSDSARGSYRSGAQMSEPASSQSPSLSASSVTITIVAMVRVTSLIPTHKVL